MRIEFQVAGTAVVFTRSWVTGATKLVARGTEVMLQSPREVGTHFSFALLQVWEGKVFGHDIVIEKRRPALFAGFRAQHYRVLVDGALAVERSGY